MMAEGFPIHGDLLEDILSHVPLIDMASVSCVSKSWESAATSSLLHLNKVKPWLFIHTQSSRSLKIKSTMAYDPRSSTWVEIESTTTKQMRVPLGSSNSNLLYQLSPDRLSFSMDSLHLAWLDIPPPRPSRVDPIVALVGSHIVVAGGVPWYEVDPLSVEMYDMETSRWSTCQSMPGSLKDSAASTWLSVASNEEFMYVIEKATGILHTFSPETKAWAGPYYIRPDPRVLFSAIGFAGDELILAGVVGYSEHVETLKIWKIKPEMMVFDEISEIPEELLEKLKGENSDLSSISLMAAKNLIYISNSSNPEELLFSEFVEGKWKWKSVKNEVFNDERRIGERMVMTCGSVGIHDLHMAMRSGNVKHLQY